MPFSAEPKSLWIESSPWPSFPRLEGGASAPPARVDVAIIGAGITGITAAVLLKEAGLKVALIEAKSAATGVTGYTTAHLTQILDTRYYTLRRDFGEDGADQVAASKRAAIEHVASWVQRRGIACAFRRLPGWLYTERESDVAELHEELHAALEAGIKAEMSREVPLPFPTVAGIRFADQADFHVRDYLRPLAESIPGDGSFLFENTRVQEVEAGAPARLVTEGGRSVTADAVIEATHSPITRFFLHTRLSHCNSYALAYPLDGAFPPGLYWDTFSPYNYTRTAKTADGREYLIIGGADHKTGQEGEGTEMRYADMAAYARDRYGITAEPAFRWSDMVVEPADGLPYIGAHPGQRGVYVATGFSGNGMTFGTLAGLILADLVQGRENLWSKLYDPARVKPFAMAREFVSQNVQVAANYVKDYLRPGDVRSVAEIAPGEGKILVKGGKRCAVYRSPEGKIQAVSAICTHLGCVVRFNAAEKSWDCPCHGSRFDAEGGVIAGPALRPLEAADLEEG